MDDYTPEEQNFLILIQALKYSTVGLKTYVDQCLEDLYDRLKNKVGSNGACTQYCSKRCNVTQWCNTCAAWKRETEEYMRYNSHKNKVQWRDIKLWKLSQTDREEAKFELFRIFVRDGRLIKHDIQTMLSLLQNCTYFRIGGDKNRLDGIRNVRNIDFAHTERFTMSTMELTAAISSLLNFFQETSFNGYQCISTAIGDINGLLVNDKQSLAKIEVYTAFRGIRKITETDINDFLSICKDKKRSDRLRELLVQLLIVILFAIIISAVFWMILGLVSGQVFWMILGLVSGQENNVLVCKNATYEPPFTMDIDFDFYRSQHDKLVGREWLLNELDEKMFFSKRGVLLLAEMGYGKSAIVAHLICQSDKRYPGNWIYQHVAVYHICNFYSKTTLSPGNFVKNLAGGFSERIPGFLHILQKNFRFQTYFENDGCLKDPEGCLDFLVLKALNEVDMFNSTYIVVIDALDECIEHGNLNIFNLLWKRLLNFPKNIKFFITSRNTSDIRIARTQLLVIEKRPSDYNNRKDANRFVVRKINSLSFSERNQLTRIFNTSDIPTIISRAIKYTNGNMLILNNLLTGSFQDLSLRSVYTTIEIVFDDQLKRIFHDRNLFKPVIKVFQVLCSTMEQLYVEELLTIADLKDDEIVDVLSIIGKELSHFISQTNGKISLVHKSMAVYLTDESRKTEQFYVSKRDGCRLFAKHFLNMLRLKRSFFNISIVDLAFYAACSSDKEIQNIFIQNSKNYINEFSDVYILHQAAAKLNSYSAMSLLLNLFSLRSVDEIDKGNITASYVAAAFGNHRSLKALLDHHADVNFTRLGPKYINETVDMLHFCKTYAFWEYSLLNIASQNGHVDTVLTLLRHNINVSHKTSFGSSSFLLAVENGHTKIVHEFLSRFKSMSVNSLNEALYLSAKNGYVDIVDLLLNRGAEDLCLSCNSSQYWTSFHQTRLQTINSGENLQKVNFVFLDDHRFIRCETAMEIAIQNDHTEVVQALLKRSNNALRCRESGGRTPLFTALKFKRSEIFNLLLHQGISQVDRCRYRRRRVEIIELNKKERKEYIKNMCPYNVTLSHYLAYNWDIDVFHLGKSYNLWEWTTTDFSGATPIHYACCAGNIDMIDILKKERVKFDVRSLNGSTPLHSAAICGKINLLSDLLSQFPTSVFDNQNRSLSHYLAMSVRYRNETTEEVVINDKCIHVSLQNKLHEEALFIDNYNRLPLHYVSKNGNVNLFSFYYSFLRNFSVVTTSMDIDGFSVLDYAFLYTPIFYKNIIERVSHCNIYLFSPDVKCNAHRLKIFIPHEYLIYLTLNISDISRGIVQQNIEKYVNISLKKNNPHLLGLLHYNLPFYYKQYIYKNGIVSLKNLLKHPSINPDIFLLLPNMSHDCSDIRSKSVLHDIIEDRKRTFWSSPYFHFHKFNLSSKSLDLCVDDNGHNLLHRSVIGGNRLAFDSLRSLGMSIYRKTRDGKNLIELLVDSAPCFEEKTKSRKLVMFVNGKVKATWVVNISISDSYSKLASYLARKTRMINNMSLLEICNPASEYLSFSHKVSAKGLIVVALEIEKRFGSKALNCANKNNITSQILLDFFNHFNKFPKYLGECNIHVNVNDYLITLFLKILMDFKPFIFPKYSVARKCSYRMKNYRNIRSLEICELKLYKEFLELMQHRIKISGLKSKSDYDRMFENTQHSNKLFDKNDCSNNFDKYLAVLKRMNENPKNPIKPTGLLKDRTLERFQTECSKTLSSSNKINSTVCCQLISNITKRKKDIISSYSFVRFQYFLLLFNLYHNKINMPFESIDRYLIKHNVTGVADYYYDLALHILACNREEFYMRKKFKSWDWLKSCKNGLAKKMMNQIGSSTIWETRKWKGSTSNIPMPILFNRPQPVPEDVHAPLDNYKLRIDDDGVS